MAEGIPTMPTEKLVQNDVHDDGALLEGEDCVSNYWKTKNVEMMDVGEGDARENDVESVDDLGDEDTNVPIPTSNANGADEDKKRLEKFDNYDTRRRDESYEFFVNDTSKGNELVHNTSENALHVNNNTSENGEFVGNTTKNVSLASNTTAHVNNTGENELMNKTGETTTDITNTNENDQDVNNTSEDAPDGGWGWMVIVGCFVITMFLPMLASCFGILYSPLLLSLGASSVSVAWVFNLFMLVWKTTVVLVGPIGKEVGRRRLAMAGGLMAAGSVMSTAFATSVIQLILCFSVMAGAGSGLCIGSAFPTMAEYFHKRRGMANAFLMGGISMGQLVNAPLIRYLQQQYAYPGATLIVGAIILNVCAGAALLQPVKWHMKRVAKERSLVELPPKDDYNKEDSVQRKSLPKESSGDEVRSLTEMPPKEDCEHESLLQLPSKEEYKHGPLSEVSPKECEYRKNFELLPKTNCKHGNLQEGRTEEEFEDKKTLSELSTKEEYEDRSDLLEMSPKEACGQISPPELALKEDCEQKRDLTKPPISPPECQGGYLGVMRRVCCGTVRELGILRQRRALVLALTGMFSINSHFNFIAMVPFAMQDAGHSLSWAAWTVSATAVTNTLARIAVSPMADHPRFPLRGVYMVGAAIVTAMTALWILVMSSSRWMGMVVMVVWGGGVGMVMGLHNLAMAQTVDLKDLTALYGANNVLVGIGFVTIGPLVGMVRDLTGSYHVSMGVLACIMSVCVLLLALLPRAVAYDTKKKASTETILP